VVSRSACCLQVGEDDGTFEVFEGVLAVGEGLFSLGQTIFCFFRWWRSEGLFDDGDLDWIVKRRSMKLNESDLGGLAQRRIHVGRHARRMATRQKQCLWPWLENAKGLGSSKEEGSLPRETDTECARLKPARHETGATQHLHGG
jgi:hypothetical protein